jgi:hypothetical protein
MTYTDKDKKKEGEAEEHANIKNIERIRVIVENEVKKHDIRKRNALVNIK